MKSNNPLNQDSDSKYSSEIQVSDGGHKHITYHKKKKAN
jgi:hypothetical protein